MGIVALVALVDPELVVLEGGVGRALGPFLDDLRARVTPSIPFSPRIVISSLGQDATLLGGVAAALGLARQRTAPAAVMGAFSVRRSGGSCGLMA